MKFIVAKQVSTVILNFTITHFAFGKKIFKKLEDESRWNVLPFPGWLRPVLGHTIITLTTIYFIIIIEIFTLTIQAMYYLYPLI